METISLSVVDWLDALRAAGGHEPPLRATAEADAVCWTRLVAVCEQLEAEFGDREATVAAFAPFASARFAQLAKHLPGSFSDPRQLYWTLQRWLLTELIPDLGCRYAELPSGFLRIALTPPDGAPPCPLAFDLIRCTLALAPQLVGHPACEVELECIDRSATYTIRLSTRSKREIPPPREAKLGQATDVTDAPVKDGLQRDYREMFDRIAGASPEILYLFDLPTWQMTYINDAVEEILGFEGREILGDAERFAELIHADDRATFAEHSESVLNLVDDQIAETSFRVRHADDSWRWIRLRNRVVKRGDDGGILEVIGAAADITDFKRAQAERMISQERYRIVSELTSDYSFSVRINRDWSMEREWITEAFERITGYRPGEMSERDWETLVHPDDLEMRRKQFEEAILAGHATHEYRIIRKTGELRVIREYSRILHNNNGTLHWYGACRDITEQKLAENARELIEERFLAITQNSPDILIELDGNGRILYASPNITEQLGHTRESLVSHRRPDLIHPEDIGAIEKRMIRLAADGGSTNAIIRMRTDDGEWRWMDTTATTFRAAIGGTRTIMISRDITDRLEIEGERRRLASIVESSSELIAMTTSDGRILFMNEAGRKLISLSDDSHSRSRKIFDCLAPEDSQNLRFQIIPTIESDGPWEGELRLRNLRTGKAISTLAHVFVVAGRRREHDQVIAFVARDITDRILSERLLRESEARHRTLVENAYDLIAEIDHDGRFVYASPNFEEKLGYDPESLVGRSWYDQLHPDDRAPARTAIRGLWMKAPRDCPPLRIRHANGSWRWVESSLTRYENTLGEEVVLAFFHDITRRTEAEKALRHSQEELLQSQKMEAIGRLAGGIAHDFNNLLTAITGYCDLLLEEIGEHSQMRADAEEIIRAADRAATLTQQLLAFSRRQVLLPKVFDLNALVVDVERLLRRLIGEDIEFETLLAGELPHVRLDPGQLEQLVINLAVNARDAMPSGGRLSIATANLEIPAEGDPAHPGIDPARYVTLSVEDTGVGMDVSTLSKIFEPFFSTKERGKGTGLGLATAYGIIQQSGGEIRVESEPGVGSTFIVYLPQVDEALPEPEATAVDEGLRGSETILLVEDSDTVRKLVLRYLEKHGYTVLDSRSGFEALKVAGSHSGPIDLLLTDVVLPKIDGHEIAKRLSEIRPATRVLYMSGFSDDALSRHGVGESDVDLIQKPFSQQQLLVEVRRVLRRTKPAGSTSAESGATIPDRSEMH